MVQYNGQTREKKDLNLTKHRSDESVQSPLVTKPPSF